MFGAKPYPFEPTYPPGEEPALNGGEERSASPEPVRVGNTKEMYFYDERRQVLSFPGARRSE